MPGRRVGFFALACCFVLPGGLTAVAQESPNQGRGTVLGTVVDPMGAGISGVQITVMQDSPSRNYDVKTDCSGFYRLPDIAAGSYSVRFNKPWFRQETRSSVLVNPSGVTHLDIKMQISPGGDSGPQIETSGGPIAFASISGTVANAAGTPIPGAQITAIEESTGSITETTTNENGSYKLSVAEWGIYSVRAKARGFNTENRRFVHGKGNPSIDIRLSVNPDSARRVTPEETAEEDRRWAEAETSGAIQGTVLDAAGAVPAKISSADEATGKRYETTTDSNGVYRFRDLPAGTYCVKFEVWRAGWHPLPKYETSNEVRVAPPGVSELNVTLPALPEIVEVCSGCMIRTGGVSTSHPKIALRLYAPSNVVKVGNELWITTTLTNISRHAVSIRAQESPVSTVDYQIYAEGECNCPGELRKRDADFISESEHLAWVRQWRRRRVRSGKTVMDKVDMSKLLDPGRPGVYRVMVEYADGLVAKHGSEVKYPPVTVSNSITVVVTGDSP